MHGDIANFFARDACLSKGGAAGNEWDPGSRKCACGPKYRGAYCLDPVTTAATTNADYDEEELEQERICKGKRGHFESSDGTPALGPDARISGLLPLQQETKGARGLAQKQVQQRVRVPKGAVVGRRNEQPMKEIHTYLRPKSLSLSLFTVLRVWRHARDCVSDFLLGQRSHSFSSAIWGELVRRVLIYLPVHGRWGERRARSIRH